MNRLFYLAFFLLISACNAEDVNCVLFSSDPPSTKTTETFKSVAESFKITERAADLLIRDVYGNHTEWSITPYTAQEDTLFYIFNSMNDGWKIVSGDSRVSPVLAESNVGHLDITRSLPIPLKILLDDSRDLMISLRKSEKETALRTVPVWKPFQIHEKRIHGGNKNRDYDAHWIEVLLSTSISPTSNVETISHLLQTKWCQDNPWNLKSPIDISGQRCKVGCVAVAVGQVMYYLNRKNGSPSRLYENVSVNQNNPLPYRNQIVLSDMVQNSSRWNDMALNSSSGGNTTYVADLLAYIGYEFFMNYGVQNSTARLNPFMLGNVNLTGIQGNYSSHNEVFSAIVQNLENEMPVLAAGWSLDSEIGHAWVIDGYIHDQTHVSSTFGYYYVEDPTSFNGYYNGCPILNVFSDEEMNAILPNPMNGSQIVVPNILNNHFFLMNWGENNGAYDDIRISQEYWTFGNKSFNENRYCIYNIQTL